MALQSIADNLKKARAERYAVPLFDLFEMTGSEDCVQAFESRRAPGIVGIYTATFERPSTPAFVACLRTLASSARVPLSLMLDHGKSIEQCRRAIALGFTDVMYDGSALPLEQNIANTRALVREAHAAGVGVEAELGQVGSGKDYQSFGGQRRGFTDPAQVERFVTESGVDMLAVAFGTAHGAYHGTPRLDLELLAEIRRRTDVPLVMHGGTGLTPEQFRAAIAAGIVKINVATDLVHSAGAAIRTAAGAQDATFFSVVKALRAALAERCTHYIDLFGAAGKGV